jgi:hypothetical protein
MSEADQVEVVLANNDRVTLRVGDVFLKIDADQRRTDVEVEAMAMAPVPTPEVLWRKPPVLALTAARPAYGAVGRLARRLGRRGCCHPEAARRAAAAVARKGRRRTGIPVGERVPLARRQ